MGIIRANRAQPTTNSNGQIQQQRTRAREAEYYQRQYDQQDAEAAYAAAPQQQMTYAPERGTDRSYDRGYERAPQRHEQRQEQRAEARYDQRQQQARASYAEQPVHHEEAEEETSNWQETANETLDAALHLASHDTRIGRLEQALGQLNNSVHALHAMQANERMRHTRYFVIGGAVVTLALLGSMFFPRYANDQQLAAKIRQAVQVAMVNPATLAPVSSGIAPLASAAPSPYAQAPATTAPMIAPQQNMVPNVAPGMPPAYGTQPGYGMQPTQQPQRQQQRIPTSNNTNENPDYLPNTVAYDANAGMNMAMDPAMDERTPVSAAAPSAIPAPPAPPIRVAQVFTPFQNKVRARVSKNGGAIPGSWQPMFDREAKGDLKGKLQVAAKFLKGEDVAHDQAFAVQLIKEAAEAGEKEAIMWLATAYQAGNLGKVDLAEAAHWYEQAGKAGITKAFTELGRIYETGIDGAPDPEVALAWYQRAASAGDIPAAEAVSRLARMTTSSATPPQAVAAAIPPANTAARSYVAANAAPASPSAVMFSAEPRTDLNSVQQQQRPVPASVAMMQPAPAMRAMGAEAPAAAADMTMASAASITPPPVTEGSTINVAMDTGEDLRAIQRMLKALGYKIDRIDGLMGPQTSNAIRSYQRNKMLYPDGEPGPQLMENLMNDMRWGN